MKKRVLRVVSVIILLIIVAAGGFGLFCYLDGRNNAYTMDVSMGPTEKTLMEENVLSYALINNSYTPVQVREIVVLSVYDENGEPVSAGGSPYTPSLVGIPELESTGRKAVQDHQVIYVTQYAVEEGKVPFTKRSQSQQEKENIHSASYILQTAEDYTVRVAVVLQGKRREEDSWQTLTGNSDTVGSVELEHWEPAVPVLTHSVDYSWMVVKDTAYLRDLGTIQEREIQIPAQVYLRKTEDGYVNDPIDGQLYPVMVGNRTLLSGTDIREVVFADGVQVENNRMGSKQTGFFQDCKELTAVYNIPKTVEEMVCTFKNCTALEETPALPETVTDMFECFKGCTALTRTGNLPDSILDLTEAFSGCAGLVEVTEFPDCPADFTGCFKGCSALSGDLEIPDGAVSYDWYFRNLKDTFLDCENIDSFVVEFCEYSEIRYVLPEEIPVVFTEKHTDEGVCGECWHMSGSYEVDGLDVYMDNIPEGLAQPLLDFLDSSVPDEMKDTCARLTFTQTLGKYNPKYEADEYESYGGFAEQPSGYAYVRVPSPVETIMNERETATDALMEIEAELRGITVLHELGHCYDYNFEVTDRYSGSAQWRRLCQEEGTVIIPWIQESYTSEQYPQEMFARMIEVYFVDDLHAEWKEACPQMYAYVAALFEEAA